jgi:hypothetical protein
MHCNASAEYLAAPRSTYLREKLTVSHVVKRVSPFTEPKRFVTVFKRVRHSPPRRAGQIQFISYFFTEISYPKTHIGVTCKKGKTTPATSRGGP